MSGERTPGPWFVDGDTFDVVYQPTSFIGDRRIVARCATGDGAMANALLVAAAPSLLAAAKAKRDAVYRDEHANAEQLLLEAIAMAEGNSTDTSGAYPALEKEPRE